MECCDVLNSYILAYLFYYLSNSLAKYLHVLLLTHLIHVASHCFLIIIINSEIKLKTNRFLKLNKYEHIRNMLYSQKYIILRIYIDSYQHFFFPAYGLNMDI